MSGKAVVGRVFLRRRAPRVHPNLHHRYSHDIAHVLGLRIFGAVVDRGRVKWRRRRALVSSCLLLSPLALAAVIALFSPPPPGQGLEYFGWLGYFLFLSVTCTLFSYGGVRVFHDLTPSLEDMLTRKGMAEYEDWADEATLTWRQAAFAVWFGVAACAALAVAAAVPAIRGTLYISFASYLCVLFVGLVLSGGAYWIIEGTRLAVRLTRPGMLRLFPYAPVATPGVEMLARCYRMAFYASCLGVSLCLVPILSWAYRIEGSLLITALKLGLFLVSVATTTAIAVVPQWRLTRVVADERRRVIQELSRALPSSPGSVSRVSDEDAFRVGWLQTLTASRSTTVSESAITGLLLGTATAALPFAIQLINGG